MLERTDGPETAEEGCRLLNRAVVSLRWTEAGVFDAGDAMGGVCGAEGAEGILGPPGTCAFNTG